MTGLLGTLAQRFGQTPLGGLLSLASGNGPGALAQTPIGGLLGLGQGAQAPAPQAAPANPMAPFLPLLDATEGGGGYDTLYGFSNREGPFAGVDVSQMTLAEAMAFADPSGPYAQWVASRNGGTVATPMGRHQIVGATLRQAAAEMGLDPNATRFDQATQDAIAAHLARRRINSGATLAEDMAGLRNEWHGFRNVPDADLAAAIQAFEQGGGAPGMAQSASTAAPEWLAYANQNATRNDPLAPELVEALSFLPELGVRAEVFSGGQEAAGQGGARTGSTRHDHGHAADVFFYDIETGRRLDWSDPNDLPRFQEIVRRGRAAGLTGFGAGDGYMQPGSMHVGFGPEAVWGAGGSSANAPDWLREAFAGGAGSTTLIGSDAPTQESGMNGLLGAIPGPIRGLLGLAGGTGTTDDLPAHRGDRLSTQNVPTGLLSPNSPLTAMPEAPRRPSIFDRFEGQEGMGWLADPERRARLAIALQGMSLNPNEAYMEMLQGDIDAGRQNDRAAQVAAWLAENGADDLAAAVQAGYDPEAAIGALMESRQPQAPQQPVIEGGMVFDPVTGALIADYRQQSPQSPLVVGDRVLTPDGAGVIQDFTEPEAAPSTDDITEYEYYRQDAEMRGETPMSPEEFWTSQRSAGAASTEVNVGGAEFSDKTNQLLAENTMAVIQQGAVAQRGMGELLTLEAALQNAPQGAAGGIASWASAMGLPVEGADDLQLAEAIISRLVPTQRPPGSGTMSDADLALFKASLPRILNQPGGNQQILSVLKNIAQYDLQRAQIAQRLALQEITPRQAFDAYNALPHPIPAELLSRLGPEAAPQAAQGAAPARVIQYDANGNVVGTSQ